MFCWGGLSFSFKKIFEEKSAVSSFLKKKKILLSCCVLLGEEMDAVK